MWFLEIDGAAVDVALTAGDGFAESAAWTAEMWRAFDLGPLTDVADSFVRMKEEGFVETIELLEEKAIISDVDFGFKEAFSY